MSDTIRRPLAVVTGGSNGIGYELAKQLIANGHDVLIAAEDPAHLAEAAQGLAATRATASAARSWRPTYSAS